MEQSRARRSAASESCSTCRSKVRARLRRSTFWISLACGICHKYTTSYDMHQSALDFRRNRSRLSHSKLSFCVRGVVSPLLSNILLTPFDQEMRRKGYQLTTQGLSAYKVRGRLG